MRGMSLIALGFAVFVWTGCGDSGDAETGDAGMENPPAESGEPEVQTNASRPPPATPDPVPGASGTPERTGPAAPAGVPFTPELALDFSKMTVSESGLYIEEVAIGLGMIAADSMAVIAHYTGWLPDGSKFDSSVDRGEPFGFGLGLGQVIQGWDEGVAGMRVGGKRRLVIPPDLAYGAGGRPPVIPPSSWLVFDIELMGFSG